MKKHSDNALKVAQYLQDHSKVSSVSYAGLKNSQYYDLQKNIFLMV